MTDYWLPAKVLSAILIFCFGLVHPTPSVYLHNLKVPTEIEEDARSELMELPPGIHRIELPSNSVKRILIAIHDAQTTGFEWTVPLQSMDDTFTDTLFVRWDTNECPHASEEEVRAEISKLLNDDASIARITLVGLGMGGVYLSQLARNWKSQTRIDVHTVAAPLNGTVGVFRDQDCGEILPKSLPPTKRFFQWRIEPSLHSIFKEMNEDPQVVDLDGSLVISLPAEIGEDAVDSTKALEIVAERIQAEYLEAVEHSGTVETQP